MYIKENRVTSVQKHTIDILRDKMIHQLNTNSNTANAVTLNTRKLTTILDTWLLMYEACQYCLDKADEGFSTTNLTEQKESLELIFDELYDILD